MSGSRAAYQQVDKMLADLHQLSTIVTLLLLLESSCFCQRSLQDGAVHVLTNHNMLIHTGVCFSSQEALTAASGYAKAATAAADR